MALALANDPALLICDEPTTALDVTVQAMILDLIMQGVAARESALLFITHDLAVVATVCQRVWSCTAAEWSSPARSHEVFTNPRHRYTQGSVWPPPTWKQPTARLPTIPGNVPAAGQFPTGCVFRTRCTHATDLCAEAPPWTGTQPTASPATTQLPPWSTTHA